jgi:hypothetical protein
LRHLAWAQRVVSNGPIKHQSKAPGRTLTFKRGELILKAQFAECRPDVVIGCAPYMQEVFRWDETRSPASRQGIVSYVADPGNPMLIEAPHPSQRRIRRQVYVDTLIEVIRNRESLLPQQN